MRKKLTAKTIDALPPATGKRYEVRDSVTTGFSVGPVSASEPTKLRQFVSQVIEWIRKLPLDLHQGASILGIQARCFWHPCETQIQTI